jgi:hypothetical protein
MIVCHAAGLSAMASRAVTYKATQALGGTRAHESLHFRIAGVWVMPTSRPSGPSSRVTT